MSEEQLRESAHSSLALILSAVATDSTTTQLSSLPGELGRLRARQGVPGEGLVAAVQLDFGVIWSAMPARARDSDMAVLALHVENLWSVVDDYARAVQQSYLEERALMAAATRDEQLTYLAELLGPVGQSPRNVRRHRARPGRRCRCHLSRGRRRRGGLASRSPRRRPARRARRAALRPEPARTSGRHVAGTPVG